jgi:hypothetical protein
MKKVYIWLVLTYVYHDAQFGKSKTGKILLIVVVGK